MTPTRQQVEDFLYREARLLDTQQFEAWLELFTDDALYWVPAGREDIDPARHVSIMHDDRAALAKRIARLRSGHAYAQDPASRIHRLVSNVEVVDPGRSGVEAHSMLLLVELLRGRQVLHTARCEYSLLGDPGAWRIRRKKVNLLRMAEPLEGIPYLI